MSAELETLKRAVLELLDRVPNEARS